VINHAPAPPGKLSRATSARVCELDLPPHQTPHAPTIRLHHTVYLRSHQPSPLPSKMAISIIHTAPEESSYIPLATFRSSTPESFTLPVLHNRQKTCTVTLRPEHATRIPAFSDAPKPENGDDDVTVCNIDFWVTSEFVTPGIILSSQFLTR
jgi:hypothetical protein